MTEKKLKILLVDDDVELREMYAEIFENANFEVIQANDGVEGLDVASKELPDVIFTGIIMPRMDGFSMVEALQKTVMTANIPIVISSHMGREEDRIRAEKLGVKDFLVRGNTPPVEVVERIGALFIEPGDEYHLFIDPFELDAQKLAKELSYDPSFKCLSCGGKLFLNLNLKNTTERIFEARVICPNCGLRAK